MTGTQWRACSATVNASGTGRDQEGLLQQYRPWLIATAGRMTSGWRVQDLAQEGWIEMWRRLEKGLDPRYPQDLKLKMHATDRMRAVLRNWRSIKNQAGSSLEGLLGQTDGKTGEAADILTQLGLTECLAGVELAYHHGEIYAALNGLSPRELEYVVLRFWYGYRKPEMRAHFGYEPSAFWRTARPKLQEALRGLAPVPSSSVSV